MNNYTLARKNELSLLESISSTIANKLALSFPESLTSQRTIGREIEMPVLKRDFSPSDIPIFLNKLVHEGFFPVFKDDYLGAIRFDKGLLSVEAGYSTLEYSSIPCKNLFSLDNMLQQTFTKVNDLLIKSGLNAFSLGVNPFVSDWGSIATPKPHYKNLRKIIGSNWDLFNITCGDHVHVSVARNEAITVRNALDLSVPLFQALFSNSNIMGGRISRNCMQREFLMRRIYDEASRTGPFYFPLTSFEDCVNIRMKERLYVTKNALSECNNVYFEENCTFGEWTIAKSHLSENELFDAYKFHDHYTWNTVRLRPDYGTVEMRVACCQPFSDGPFYPALVLGIAENAEKIVNKIMSLLPSENERKHWSLATLENPILQNTKEFYLGGVLLQLAIEGLQKRGLGEEKFIHPLFVRHQNRENPALNLISDIRHLGLYSSLAKRSLSYTLTKNHY